MRSLLVLMGGVVLLAGCMSPRAQSYLDACLESGRNPGECKMMAHEIDIRVWRNIQDAGAAMQRAAPPPVPIPPSPIFVSPRPLTCYSHGRYLTCQ